MAFTLVIMNEHEATTAEAAAELRVHVVTLQRWAKEGIVTPAYRTVGGRYRWDMADLKRQLRERGMGETGMAEPSADTPIHPPTS